jgi:hypothetical protein
MNYSARRWAHGPSFALTKQLPHEEPGGITTWNGANYEGRLSKAVTRSAMREML